MKRSIGTVPLFIVALLFVLPGTASAETIARTESFPFSGDLQTWTVPDHVTAATFSLHGGSGGSGAGASFMPKPLGGNGAHLVATLPLTPGEALQLFVGGAAPGNGSEVGGYNGGGAGPYHGNLYALAGGGGGATDVRTGPGLADRLLVAGGGGGAGGNGMSSGPGGNNGPSGGVGGGSGSAGADGADSGGHGGGAGTLAQGGAGGAAGAGDQSGADGYDGELGQGGAVSPAPGGQGGDSGGGGGGYYGGGSGGTGGGNGIGGGIGGTLTGNGGGGGGGGSSFAVPAATVDQLTEGENAGDGRIDITYDEPVEPGVSLDSGPTGVASLPVTFTFSSPQSDSAFECRMDGGAWSTCTSPLTRTALAAGTHRFEVTAVSPEGLRSDPATRDFETGQAPPPKIRKLAVTPKRVTGHGKKAGKHKSGPALVKVRITTASVVRFRIRRNSRLPKRLRGRSYPAFAMQLRHGLNTVRLGRLIKRRLPAGRYRVTAVARDSHGQRSVKRLAGFRVVR